ncbi:UNVERIFIED_CONTAM: hypothetical protein K2H54_056099 [Gekko kuhli]
MGSGAEVTLIQGDPDKHGGTDSVYINACGGEEEGTEQVQRALLFCPPLSQKAVLVSSRKAWTLTSTAGWVVTSPSCAFYRPLAAELFLQRV